VLAAPARLGIELSPAACRIVELDWGTRSGRDWSATRVRTFARLPRDGVETQLKLSAFGRHMAAAVVWGLQADHRHAVVSRGSFRRMRREAVTAMEGGGVETHGRVADIFAAPRVKGASTRSVVVALASTTGLAAAMRWLSGQGVRVQSIVTPALGLMSLARLRRLSAVPNRLEAYVALEETTTAVALVRNGLLLAAGELEWGYRDVYGRTLPRDDLASRLSHEIERFVAARGARPDALAEVCVCGGLPELRSMALGLTEQLDVEVETLDSLFGIDAAHLPQPGNEFREHAAELRLAWAAAADWPAPVNLLRERSRRLTKTTLSRAAVAAGVVTGIGIAWQLQRTDWAQSSRPVAQAIGPPVKTPIRAAPPGAGTAGTALRAELATARPPGFSSRAPRLSAIPGTPVVPIAPEPPAAQPRLARPPDVRVPSVVPRRAVQPRGGLPSARDPEPGLPFDAVLGTILYAPDRKLAIVDGRIVQSGDEVNGALVIDITPTAVLLRDAQGRLRRLGLGASGR
jgi:hypothetical protein